MWGQPKRWARSAITVTTTTTTVAVINLLFNHIEVSQLRFSMSPVAFFCESHRFYEPVELTSVDETDFLQNIFCHFCPCCEQCKNSYQWQSSSTACIAQWISCLFKTSIQPLCNIFAIRDVEEKSFRLLIQSLAAFNCIVRSIEVLHSLTTIEFKLTLKVGWMKAWIRSIQHHWSSTYLLNPLAICKLTKEQHSNVASSQGLADKANSADWQTPCHIACTLKLSRNYGVHIYTSLRWNGPPYEYLLSGMYW